MFESTLAFHKVEVRNMGLEVLVLSGRQDSAQVLSDCLGHKMNAEVKSRYGSDLSRLMNEAEDFRGVIVVDAGSVHKDGTVELRHRISESRVIVVAMCSCPACDFTCVTMNGESVEIFDVNHFGLDELAARIQAIAAQAA